MAVRLTLVLAVTLLLSFCVAGSAPAAPVCVSVSINQGDAKTSSDVVWLYMTASTTDPPMEMRFSNWGYGFSSDWEPYFSKKLWMLEPAGTLNATKGVTVEVRDAVGTTQAHDSIFVTSPLNPNVIAQKRWHFSNLTQNAVSLAGNPVGICFDGLNLWVTKYSDAYLAKIRAPDRTLLSSTTYTTGTSPYDVVCDGMHTWTVNYNGSSVTKRELDGTLIGTIVVGASPHRTCFDGTYVWVACAGDNKLYRINAATDAVESSPAIGNNPRGVAFDGNNLWVTLANDDVVKKVRPSDYTVLATYPVGDYPEPILFDGLNIWVVNRGDDTVIKLRAVDGANKGTFSVGTDPADIVFDGAVIWVSSYTGDIVSKLRAADGAPWGTVSVPDGPWGLAFDGANVWVACYWANEVVRL